MIINSTTRTVCRTLCSTVFSAFKHLVIPVADKLRMGILHNDLNEQNIIALESGPDPQKFPGAVKLACIDFGDVVVSWRVNEVAIALDPAQSVVIEACAGSGKTWLAERLMAALPSIRVRSDIERKRIFGLDESAESGSGIGSGIYTVEASAETYERLFTLADRLLAAGHHVILDAAFLKKKQRVSAGSIASSLDVDSVLVSAEAPVEVLRSRIEQRAMIREEASEADLAVLEHQLRSADPLENKEAAIRVDTSLDIDIEALVARILKRGDR